MTSAKFIEVGLDEGYHSISPEHNGFPIGQESPPNYFANSSSLPKTSDLQPIADFPRIDFSSYRLPRGTISNDKTTCTTTELMLTHDASALLQLLQRQAALPPKPLVRIRGSHADRVNTWGHTKIDFDLTLDVMPLIMPSVSMHSGYISVKPISGDERDSDPLESWVRRFCNDTTECKSFTLERQVTNWDTCFLERKIRDIVISAKYKGSIDVTFPIASSKVTVLKGRPRMLNYLNDHQSSSKKQKWLGRSRSSEAGEAMTVHGTTHAYNAVQVVWPYADSPFASSSMSTSQSDSVRRCTVQSEQDWLSIWRGPIRNNILKRREGWVTVEDWKEAVMGVEFPEPKKNWGTYADDWQVVLKNCVM